MGRHKITTEDLRKDWKEFIIEEMSKGASLCEIQSGLDITDKTYTRLCQDEKIFFRTIKKGKKLSETWWQKKARKNLHNTKFNATLWYMNMKNRFGWRDKQDITSNNKEIKIEISETLANKYKK